MLTSFSSFIHTFYSFRFHTLSHHTTPHQRQSKKANDTIYYIVFVVEIFFNKWLGITIMASSFSSSRPSFRIFWFGAVSCCFVGLCLFCFPSGRRLVSVVLVVFRMMYSHIRQFNFKSVLSQVLFACFSFFYNKLRNQTLFTNSYYIKLNFVASCIVLYCIVCLVVVVEWIESYII